MSLPESQVDRLCARCNAKHLAGPHFSGLRGAASLVCAPVPGACEQLLPEPQTNPGVPRRGTAGYALPLLAEHPVASAASDIWSALQTVEP